VRISKLLKKITAFTLIFIMTFSLVQWDNVNIAHAAEPTGKDLGGGIKIKNITLSKVYDENRNSKGMYLEITATADSADISNLSVKYKNRDNIFKPFTKQTIKGEKFIQFEFTAQEISDFNGSLLLRDQVVISDLNFNNLPTISKVPKKIINTDVDEDTATDGIQYFLTVEGTNLDSVGQTIDDFNYKLYISKSAASKEVISTDIAEQKYDALKMKNLTPPGAYGFQDMVFKKIKSSTELDIEINHTYYNQFRFVKNLVVNDLRMYPNVGTNGDSIYFEGKDLPQYDVHFLSVTGNDSYSDTNKGTNPVFEENTDGNGLNRLTVKVPSAIAIGQYNVYLTQTQDREIIAEKFVDVFTVIEKGNKATITKVYPNKGPSAGNDNVEIEGNNLVRLNIPGLDISYSKDTITFNGSTNSGSVPQLVINYPDVLAKYNGVSVSEVKRTISVLIGSQAKFKTDDTDPDKYKILLGNPDYLYVITQSTTQIDTDPIVDVKATLTTTFKDINGNEYKFVEIAEKKDGYEFIPSSSLPLIKSVTPEKVQLEEVGSDRYNLKEEILLAVTGENFMVHKFTDASGNMITRYPIVIIKTANDNELGNYEIKLDKNEDKIYYKDGTEQFITGLTLDVLDQNGNIIDGSDGKEFGTKIVMRIPKSIILSSAGKRNIQVVNPKRQSTEPGSSSIKVDAVEFVKDLESPAIESVEPNIVTIEGGQDIIVKGNNFQEGIKVYINAQEVKGVTREVDRSGNKILLKFKAPKGTEGETQLLVMNPDGGQAVYPFIYVKTYTKPSILKLNPNLGTEGTPVVVDGDNFLKTDPTVTNIDGFGIYKLIGTRILMDGKEINEYNKNAENTKIILKPYQSASNNVILRVENSQLVVADYYYSIILEREVPAGEKPHYYTLDIDPRGNVILSDGINDKYTITAAPDGTIKADKEGGGEYGVNVDTGKIIIDPSGSPITLNITTPYKFSDETKAIIGNRVRIINKNQLIFTVPALEQGTYDVTVINPDTNSATIIDGFTYKKDPPSTPVIDSVNPSQGSTEGDYFIEIYGKYFEHNADPQKKTKVYIGGVLVSPDNVTVDIDGKTIKVKVPPYPGDIRQETGTDRKTVPVIVVNHGGGTGSKLDGFTYIIPRSNPEIDSIDPTGGNAAGGITVQLRGSDFRLYEPFTDSKGDSVKVYEEVYTDSNGNGKWDEGEPFEDKNRNNKYDSGLYYVDINGDGEWTDLRGVENIASLGDGDKKILPQVYFGKFKVSEYIAVSDERLIVKLPAGEKGNVDVYVVNNDYGISNKKPFAYNASSPKIDSITPSKGKKQGKDDVEIVGKEFSNSTIQVYNLEKDAQGKNKFDEKIMPLVRFGDITNRASQINDLDYGLIGNNETASVTLGAITVEYKGKDDMLTIKTIDGKYAQTFTGYDDTIKYIPVGLLKNVSNSTESYPEYELVRVEINKDDRRLIVERGYSPEAELKGTGQIIFKTPSYPAVGITTVRVINPDSGVAEGKFEYKNPDSRPAIITITKDGKLPQDANVPGYGDVKILRLTAKGGNIVKITGTDFRPGARVLIPGITDGNGIAPATENITPSNITFKMFAVPDNVVSQESIGIIKLYRVVVLNEDGGMTASDNLIPPIYLMFIKGETSPQIDKITPDKGPSNGGTRVKIEGKDFREKIEGMEGENNKFTVYFDGVPLPETNVTVVDTGTVYITTPSHAPGPVEIKVENPDGELSNTQIFTFISNPKITAVVDPADPSENTKIDVISVEGGQEIKLKGSGYQEGSKVVFNPVLKKIEEGKAAAGNVIYINGDAYTLEQGTEGTDVKFINSETLTVKTPQGKMGTTGVIVINPDGGASEIYEDITYSLPEIGIPQGVAAELVYNRYIKVNWLEVEGAREYEIYVVVDNTQVELIGSTKLTSFVYEDLEPRTTYKFIVKAVGEYNISKPSRESNSVRTGSKVGPPDDDGQLNDKTTMDKVGDQANIIIGEDSYSKEMTIDLTRGTLAGSKEVVISMSAKIASSYRAKSIKVIGKDFVIKFNPNNFNTSKVAENDHRKDAGVRFKISPYTGSSDLDAGKTALSTQYVLEANVFVGKDSTPIDYLTSGMEITLDFDAAKADMRRLKNIGLNRYDQTTQSWMLLANRADSYGTSIRVYTDRLGRYLIFGSKN
jgi:hypothetical protein